MNYAHITNGLVDNIVLFDAAMPEDWTDFANFVQSDTAQIGWSYADGSFIAPAAPTPPAPTGADVDAERDRRRQLPCAVTTSPTGSFQVNMDPTSQSNIQALTTIGMYLAGVAPTQTTAFRDLANVNHNLLPSELVAMGLGVAAYIQRLYARSWALKAMTPIPSNYTDDSFWA